jgi:flagellar hook-associated protein 2
MTPIALSGLASNLDTESIITQLMSVEQQPRTRMVLADTQAQSRQSTLHDLATKLGAVRDAAAALRSTTTWASVQTATSSDATSVSARAFGSTPPGKHTVAVSQLATKAQHAFEYTASGSPQKITIGTYELNVDANASVATVAAAINGSVGAPVSAVVANDRLYLTNRTTGTAADLPVVSALLGEDVPLQRLATDAKYTVDGGSESTSQSNVVTAVLGIELTLKATTSGPVTIEAAEPGVDTDGVKAKIKTFVNAYNGAVDFIRGELTEKPVKNPATNSDAVKGLFFGDTMLSGVLSSMRSQIGDLSSLGISTGATTGTATISADAVAGRLTVDDTKLTAALAGDKAKLRTSLSDLGQRVGAVVAPVAGARVDQRLSSVDATRKRIASDMAAIDVRLATKEKRLRAQFSAMESALASAQAAQAQMKAQLSTL